MKKDISKDHALEKSKRLFQTAILFENFAKIS